MSQTVDVNKPVENPELRARLDRLAEQPNDENYNWMLEEIAMRANFLSVIVLSKEPHPNADGTATFEQDTTMQFPMLTTDEDRLYYPAFTDWGELNRWGVEQSPKTLILTFDDYAAMVQQSEGVKGITINPFHDNVVLERELLVHMQTKKEQLLAAQPEA